MLLIFSTLMIFVHLDISGNDSNSQHLLNKPSIIKTLEVFQFDISGKDLSELQLPNIQ